MSSNAAQPDLILELLNFLQPKFESQNAVQVIALQNLLQFTPAGNPNRHLFSQKVPSQQQTWITVISNACKRESLGSVGQHAAINILVNLTDGVERVNAVVKDAGWLEWAVKIILQKDTLLADPLCMLLSNLTQKSESVSASLLSLKFGETSAFAALLDQFVNGADKNLEVNKHANFDFLASSYANMTTLPAGRTALLSLPKDNKGESAVTRIAAFTEHSDTIRRGGVASILKNLCFDTSAHEALLSPEEHNVLPRILLPLCGPEEYPFEEMDSFPPEVQLLEENKAREPDAAIRCILLEALLLFSSSSDGKGREHLRSKNVYRIVQVLHLSEEDERNKELCVRLVGLLMRDELSKDMPGQKIQEIETDPDLEVQEI